MKVKILTKNHEHNGKLCEPGAVVEVDDKTGALLIDKKIAAPAS